MSYYGMRALLELFMVDSMQNGGLLLLAFGKYRHQFGAFKETFRES